MGGRKRVMWDEKNLEDNEEYRRAHPVTMHITEPKTPFHYPEDEEDFEDALERIEEGEMDAERQDDSNSTWDPEVNQVARRVREEFRREAPVIVAPVAPSGRPMLSFDVVSGEALERQREVEFKTMRKAVYADEGARVKALLGKGNVLDEDEEEDDEEEKREHEQEHDEEKVDSNDRDCECN